jgi:glutamate/tyrosine decarboxylase-like PLP-dependent enzyme
MSDQTNKKINALRQALSLSGGESQSPGPWFLGPKGESYELLLSMLQEALHHSVDGRTSIYPEDPRWADPDSVAYKTESRRIQDHYRQLVRNLESYSVPFSSYRYQGHMLWDQTLPSIAGYFAALLYNQNNVAAEASPLTTALEMEVAADLCRMVGFGGEENIEPWGHITCDGSIANIEALWAGRNTKLYPFAVYAALKEERVLQPLTTIEVQVTGPISTKKKFVNLDMWELMNLNADIILVLPTVLNCEAKKHKIDKDKLNLIKNYTVQNLGMMSFASTIDRILEANGAFQKALENIRVVGPATIHYSLTKAATLLGLGTSAFTKIQVESNARMKVGDLEVYLDECYLSNKPVLTVICVIGTTEEGAVDNLAEVLALRDKMRKKGMDFFIHADGAWGGYFTALLNPPSEHTITFDLLQKFQNLGTVELNTNPQLKNFEAFVAFLQLQNLDAKHRAHENFIFTHETGLNAHTVTQLRKLKFADSITVDPHKSGFTLYPAGSLLYRDRRMPEMIQITAPVVYHDGDAPTVGVFGVEGSKPGAAAAGVYFSHRIIKPDQSGYGRILGRCTFNSKRFFAELMAIKSQHFIIAALTDLTDEELDIVRGWAPLSNLELWGRLSQHPNEYDIFRRTGPDLNIFSYALNPVIEGKINTDPTKANQFNNELFKRLSRQTIDESLPDLIITGSSFNHENSLAPIRYLRNKLGLDQDDKLDFKFLITTVMNPWLTDADHGTRNMIPKLVEYLQKKAESLVHQLYDKPKPEC